MKRLLLSVAVLTLTPSLSLAGDLPSANALPLLSPPPLVWDGMYVGLNAGGVWGNNNTAQTSSWPLLICPCNPGPNPSGPSDYALAAILGLSGPHSAGNLAGFIGGGQVGYNWQFMTVLLGSVEADIHGIAGASGSDGAVWTNVPVAGNNILNHSYLTGSSVRNSLDYLGTVRGRIGYLINPTILVYGTGGLAYGGVSLNASSAQIPVNHPPNFPTSGPGNTSFSGTRAGWTAGGGVEWMFLPNWSAKAEYLYYDLGSARTNTGFTVSSKTDNPDAGVKFLNGSVVTSRINGNMVRAGVNYHFNWGPPLLAKF